MKAILLKEFGGPEKLVYEEFEEPKIKEDEVLVRVRACALNRLDLWIRKGARGTLKLPHILGSDVSGEVYEIGKAVSKFNIGDKVMVSPNLSCGKCYYCLSGQDNLCPEYSILGAKCHGGYAEYLRIPEVNLISLPSNKSFEEAAAFPLTFLTAWRMLVTHAKVGPGKTLLIWGGGSGVGSAAIQIAKLFNAKIITTVGREDKAPKAKEIGADYVLNHYKDDIVGEVKKITKDEGVDIVIDHVGEAVWERSLLSLKKGGILVNCGGTSGINGKVEIRRLYWNHLKIIGSTMGTKGELLEAVKFFAEGKLKPVIHQVFPLRDASEAHRVMEEGKHFGKLVLKVS
ncbi:MAG: zinc-binding dehydrogenase [Nitrososphaerales archaeon]